MKSIRTYALPIATLAAALFLSLTSSAQHGHPPEPPEQNDHFEVVAERLELTASQKDTLAKTFGEAFTALQELHRLHDVIAKDLTDAQKKELARMVHDALGGDATHEGGHGRSHR